MLSPALIRELRKLPTSKARMRFALAALGMSQEALCLRVKVSTSHLSRGLHGYVVLSLELRARIAAEIGAPVHALFANDLREREVA